MTAVKRTATALKPGADVFYKLTSGLTLSLTANTDFAETEVDEAQVNLTRFPVLFLEKRQFFLEDAGNFAVDDLAPTSGFVPRRGIRRFGWFLEAAPRPHRWGTRQILCTFDGNYFAEPETNLLLTRNVPAG
jgi:hypothetical protein